MRFLLILALVLSQVSVSPPTPPQQPKTASTTHNAKEASPQNQPRESFWQRTRTDPVALYTLVLAIFTGLLVAVSGVQGWFLLRADETARIAANAAKESAESYKMSERAWVSFVGFKSDDFEGTDAAGHPISGMMFAIRWENAGQTPALRCRIMSDHKLVAGSNDKEIPVFAREPGAEESQKQAALVPGVSVTSPRRFIARAELQNLMEHKSRLFVYGRADYDLIFPQEGGANARPQTEVCAEIQYFGDLEETGKPYFNFTPIGPQNSAR